MPREWPPALPDSDHARAVDVYSDLVRVGAYPNTNETYIVHDGDPAVLNVLECLQAALLVQSVEIRTSDDDDDNVFGWALTQFGMDAITAYDVLEKPLPALRRRDGIANKDYGFLQIPRIKGFS